MDSKAPNSYTAHLAWIIPAVIALLGIVLDHMDLATAALSKIWNLFFVNIWYLWMAATGYGLYRFVRLIQNLHNVTNNVLPSLMKADAENLIKTLKAVEKESASRVSSDNSLSSRIASLDTRTLDDCETLRKELRAEFSQAIQKEGHQRADGINALQRELEKQFERMNKIESRPPADRPPTPAELLATSKPDPQSAVVAAILEADRKKRL